MSARDGHVETLRIAQEAQSVTQVNIHQCLLRTNLHQFNIHSNNVTYFTHIGSWMAEYEVRAPSQIQQNTTDFQRTTTKKHTQTF